MMLGARVAIRTGVAALVLMAGLGVVLGAPDPASAAEPSVSVSPASGLDPAGDFVVVTGRGFDPNSQLFVMQCRHNSNSDHTCNSVGLQKVTTDAQGSFVARGVKVIGRFGATDCATTQCAVKTSAVQGHSGDRSKDRSANISFGAPAQPPATQPPATQPPVTQPPVTQAPASTTTAVVTTTSTTEVVTSTTEAPATTSTTEVDAAVEGSNETAGDAANPAAAPTDDDDDASSTPLVVGIVVLVLAAAGSAFYFIRKNTQGAS